MNSRSSSGQGAPAALVFTAGFFGSPLAIDDPRARVSISTVGPGSAIDQDVGMAQHYASHWHAQSQHVVTAITGDQEVGLLRGGEGADVDGDRVVAGAAIHIDPIDI